MAGRVYQRRRRIVRRSRSRFGRSRTGQYRAARAGTDRTSFIVASTVTVNLSFQQYHSTSAAQTYCNTNVLNLPIMQTVMASNMGQTLANIYDDIRLKSARVMFTYNGSSLNRQVNMITAIERNGVKSLFKNVTVDGGVGARTVPIDVASYGSCESKAVNAYVSGSVRRTVFPSTVIEKSVYWPSAVTVASYNYLSDPVASNFLQGYESANGSVHPFNPCVLCQFQGSTTAAETTIPVKVQIWADVQCRGVRSTM